MTNFFCGLCAGVAICLATVHVYVSASDATPVYNEGFDDGVKSTTTLKVVRVRYDTPWYK